MYRRLHRSDLTNPSGPFSWKFLPLPFLHRSSCAGLIWGACIAIRRRHSPGMLPVPEQDWDGLTSSITLSLTACDEAIARELFARMLTTEIFRDEELPELRDLSQPCREEVFCGIDLAEDAAILRRTVEKTLHKLKRYIDGAFEFALTHAYVPLRTGILDPFLSDPCNEELWPRHAGTGPLFRIEAGGARRHGAVSATCCRDSRLHG